MYDLTYERAKELAEHLIAIGETTVYLHDDTGFDYSKVVRVEAGSTYRLSIPVNAYLIAEDAGLTLKLSFNYEGYRESGKGTSMFDREKLRDVMSKLPDAARASFVAILRDKVLPEMVKRGNEYREALMRQDDSTDCVRGLIAMVEEQAQ